MLTKWNSVSLLSYAEKVSALLKELENAHCSIHIGTANSKTKMVNEGTSAGYTGTCDCSCKDDCFATCYAIVHGDGIYKTARKNHAENTIMRRRNREAYYTAFFKFADKKGKALRVNETGDFECPEDICALFKVAKMFPNVRVIGYTKRLSLLSHIAELNTLPNVCIHYSLAFCGNGKAEAENLGVPMTKITLEVDKCSCPNQIAKRNGKKWSCEMCAENGCGCFSKKDIYFLAH